MAIRNNRDSADGHECGAKGMFCPVFLAERVDAGFVNDSLRTSVLYGLRAHVSFKKMGGRRLGPEYGTLLLRAPYILIRTMNINRQYS
jgi:hypothetical protein